MSVLVHHLSARGDEGLGAVSGILLLWGPVLWSADMRVERKNLVSGGGEKAVCLGWYRVGMFCRLQGRGLPRWLLTVVSKGKGNLLVCDFTVKRCHLPDLWGN